MENLAYDKALASKAQDEYCEARGLPNFAGQISGVCFRCGNSVYLPVVHRDKNITGITVERAGAALITGCPHCRCSFAD